MKFLSMTIHAGFFFRKHKNIFAHYHCNDVIMTMVAYQITSLTIVYSASLAFVREFPAQMASNAENVSIWWRHHDKLPHYNDTRSLTPSPYRTSINAFCNANIMAWWREGLGYQRSWQWPNRPLMILAPHIMSWYFCGLASGKHSLILAKLKPSCATQISEF